MRKIAYSGGWVYVPIRDNARSVNGGAMLLFVAAVVARGIGTAVCISAAGDEPLFGLLRAFTVITFTLKWF